MSPDFGQSATGRKRVVRHPWQEAGQFCVILTTDTAWASEETIQSVADQLVDDIEAFVGRPAEEGRRAMTDDLDGFWPWPGKARGWVWAANPILADQGSPPTIWPNAEPNWSVESVHA